MSAHANPLLALAGAALLPPDAFKVRGAGPLEVGELSPTSAETGGLVKHLVVVAVEHVALASAGTAVLVNLDGIKGSI